MTIIDIKDTLGTPKYKQIVASIENTIAKGHLKKGDKLPSLNRIKTEHNLSRDTVLSAFNELKIRGIITSVVGKGYYVASENIKVSQKIFLLFDEFNSFKEDLYNSFVKGLGNHVKVDIFFHHFNAEIFSTIINDKAGTYSYYVIMPANLTGIAPIIQRLPDDKVYILDQMPSYLSHYPSIYQNFKKDIYSGLQAGLRQITTYKKVILLYNKERQPPGILKGFQAFCTTHALKNEVISRLKGRPLSKGELYILLDDKNLIRVIKRMQQQDLKLVKDIGIISYNDTLLKEIVEGGITTISTNFNLMGERLAQMILKQELAQIQNPNRLIIRQSL